MTHSLGNFQNSIYIPLTDEGLRGFSPDEIIDQKSFEAKMRLLYDLGDNRIGWSGFGEKRPYFFTSLGYDQMVQQKRFIHLGVDVWLSAGTSLYSPMKGEVVESGYEEGSGNYGGYVVIQYGDIFCFYGHLNPDTLCQKGTIETGEKIGEIGDMTMNGGYFEHLHFQVLTQKGWEAGYAHKGYETEEGFSQVYTFVLNAEEYFSYIAF